MPRMYTLTYKCGHQRHFQGDIDSSQRRFRMWGAKNKLCDACQQEMWDWEEAKGLPALRGSNRQCQKAEGIRRQGFEAWEQQGQSPDITKRPWTIDDAVWWIEIGAG